MGVHGKSRFEVWGKEEGLGDVKGRKGGKEKSGKVGRWGGGKEERWGSRGFVLDLSNKSVLKVSVYIYITKS